MVTDAQFICKRFLQTGRGKAKAGVCVVQRPGDQAAGKPFIFSGLKIPLCTVVQACAGVSDAPGKSDLGYNQLLGSQALGVKMATTPLMSGLEFDALPYEEGRRWELLEGELIPRPSPTLEHQKIVQNLQFALMVHLKAHPDQAHREKALACADVEFALDKYCRVRPDVLVLLACHPERW